MKFGIVTISHGRNEILELFCLSMKRLRKEFGFFPVVCVGDEGHKEICNKYLIDHITQNNRPVSEKWNTGTRFLRDKKLDYIMILGSDDIVSNDLMRNMITGMRENVDMLYVNSIYFYCSQGSLRGTFKLLNTKVKLGVAKTLNKRVWESVDYCGWNKSINFGMDSNLHATISGHLRSSKKINGMVVDVKSNVNINKFTMWNRKIHENLEPKLFYDILSEEEKQLLDTL